MTDDDNHIDNQKQQPAIDKLDQFKSTDINQNDTIPKHQASEWRKFDRIEMLTKFRATDFMVYGSTEQWLLFYDAIINCEEISIPTITDAVILITENIDNKDIKLKHKTFFIKWSFFLLCCFLYIFDSDVLVNYKIHINKEKCLLFYQMYMGHLMLMATKYILNILHKSRTELTELLLFYGSIFKSFEESEGVHVDQLRFVSHTLSYFRHLKSNFEEVTQNYLGNAITQHELVKRFKDSEYYFIFGKIVYIDIKKSTLIKKEEQQVAIEYLVRATTQSDKLYVTISSLRYLSKLCYYFDQYVISLKLLKYAFRLCHIDEDIIISPSFVNYHYRKLKKSIKKKLKRLTCSFCKQQKPFKLKACSGCSERMYCSKSCQKKDWNKLHRLHCWKRWEQCYTILKEDLFDRLQINIE